MFSKLIAKNLRKPKGILGYIITNQMMKHNTMVYPSIDAHADIQDGMKLLEIGFGPGVGLSHFSKNYSVTIDGIDFSQLMHKRAFKRNKQAINEGKITIKVGDFLSESLPVKRYDRIYFANVTYFWKELVSPFQKIANSLSDGGKVVFYMTDKELLDMKTVTSTDLFNRHSSTSVLISLEQCGFTNIQVHKVLEDNEFFLVVEGTKSIQ